MNISVLILFQLSTYHVVRAELAAVRQVVRGVDLGRLEPLEVQRANLVADEHGGRAVDKGAHRDRVRGEDVEGVVGDGDVDGDRDAERGQAEDLADGGQRDDFLEVGPEDEEYPFKDLRRQILYALHWIGLTFCLLF